MWRRNEVGSKRKEYQEVYETKPPRFPPRFPVELTRGASMTRVTTTAVAYGDVASAIKLRSQALIPFVAQTKAPYIPAWTERKRAQIEAVSRNSSTRNSTTNKLVDDQLACSTVSNRTALVFPVLLDATTERCATLSFSYCLMMLFLSLAYLESQLWSPNGQLPKISTAHE